VNLSQKSPLIQQHPPSNTQTSHIPYTDNVKLVQKLSTVTANTNSSRHSIIVALYLSTPIMATD